MVEQDIKGRKFVFGVGDPTVRLYLICVSNEADRASWIRVLRKVIDFQKSEEKLKLSRSTQSNLSQSQVSVSSVTVSEGKQEEITETPGDRSVDQTQKLKEEASEKIIKNYRAWRARREFLKDRNRIVKSQALVRMYLQRKRYKEKRSKIIKIQAVWRAKQAITIMKLRCRIVLETNLILI